MHRRQFIALLGATAAAGCTGQSTPTDEPATTARTTSPPTAEETAEAQTARPTERETERPESTPTRGEELVERGRTHLLAAIDEFTADAEPEDATIVDVNAATTEFSRFDVNDELQSAQRHLTDAKNYTSPENTAVADDLLVVAAFVNALGFAQNHLVNAYEEVNRARRSFYTESYEELPGNVEDVADQRDRAAEYAATIRESFDESTVAPVAQITAEHFSAKLDQVDRELAAFDGIATQLSGLDALMERFADDVRAYKAMRYDDVGFSAGDFEDVATGLAAIERPVSLEPVLAELSCVFDALADGTGEMREAVIAKQNDEHAAAREYEADAEAAYQSCETLVEEVRPVADLVETIPR